MPAVSEEPRAFRATAKRNTGRPKTIDAAPASLAHVLALIRDQDADTRPDIELASGLSRAAVVDRLAVLTALGLIEEAGTGRSTGGRAPKRLAFRADAGTLLVATADRSSIAVGVADLRGHVLAEHHEAADFSAGAATILDRLTTLFLWLIEENGGKDGIWGIGLALPGPVYPSDANPIAHDDDWREIDLAAELAYRIGAPAWIRSGTEMMTVGEMKAGDGAADMLFVKLGRSITAGLVINGRLHRGVQGVAGMIGHAQTSETSEAPCRCGKRGCLESIVGADAIARSGREGAETGASRFLADVLGRTNEVTVADVANGAQLGDAFCAELAARCGRLLGESLAPLANLLNPSVIVLGGSIVQAGDILLAALREAVYRNAHPLVTRDLRLLRSRMGGSSGLIGAAQLAAGELFLPEMVQRWIPHGSPRRLPDLATLAAAARARHRLDARREPPAPPPATLRPNGPQSPGNAMDGRTHVPHRA